MRSPDEFALHSSHFAFRTWPAFLPAFSFTCKGFDGCNVSLSTGFYVYFLSCRIFRATYTTNLYLYGQNLLSLNLNPMMLPRILLLKSSLALPGKWG